MAETLAAPHGRCASCLKWTTERQTRYEDGSVISNFKAPEGMGRCELLGVDTVPQFGCTGHAPAEKGWSGVFVTQKAGAPWQYSKAGPCPDCKGKGSAGDTACHRCAGTSQVRYYEDGYIGEERTRLHPKEKAHAAPPACQACGKPVQLEWVACPACGERTEAPAKTEVIALDLGGPRL